MSKQATYGLLTVIMLIWGLNTVAIKVLVQHFPPVPMQGVRLFLAGIAALAILFFRRKWRRLTAREWKYTLAAMLFGVIGHHALLAVGLFETTATNGALILALLPLTTSVLSSLFLKDALTAPKTAGILLGLCGVSMVVLTGKGGVGEISVGDVYVFGSMMSQAISFIFIKKATDTLDPKWMTAVMFLTGSAGLLLLGAFLPADTSWKNGEGIGIWLLLLGSAWIATALGHTLYNSAIHRLGPGDSAIFINLTPFFALVGSVLFLGEQIWIQHVIGFVFIVGGVILGTGALDDRWNRLRSTVIHPEKGNKLHS